MEVKHKRVAIYSNAWNANAGGGIAYVLAIAKILANTDFNVTVYFYESVSVNALKALYGIENLNIKTLERMPLPLTAQLKYAYNEWLSFDVVILQALEAPRLTFVKKSFILCDFPMKAAVTLSDRVRLKTWRHVIANSKFTKEWILQKWKRSAHVVYPPVENTTRLFLNKNEDWVCIGRFNQGKRSKRQDMVIESFIDVYKNGKTNCKLHLIGFVEDSAFVNKLKKQAEGFPVVFHENCPLEKQKHILEQSSFYVSACGYGIDEKKEPMFVEHYGISVVEAMAHGCIPLVVGKGGHKETVQHKENGYHWDTLDELKSFIMSLISNKALKDEMSKKAFLKASDYSYQTVAEQINEMVIN